MRRICLLLSLVLALACSDDETTTTGPATGGNTGNGGNGGNGQGGDGGEGGAFPPVQCGGDITFDAFHNCDVSNLTDFTAETEVTIQYGFDGTGFVYTPRCIHVCNGARINLEVMDGTDFQVHPLAGGEAPNADSASPIPEISTAGQSEASFAITEAGSFPYFCVAHVNDDMRGAIYVQ